MHAWTKSAVTFIQFCLNFVGKPSNVFRIWECDLHFLHNHIGVVALKALRTRTSIFICPWTPEAQHKLHPLSQVCKAAMNDPSPPLLILTVLHRGWSLLLWLVCFSLHHCVQTTTWAHPASYPVGTRDSFRGGKGAGAWSWLFTSI